MSRPRRLFGERNSRSGPYDLVATVPGATAPAIFSLANASLPTVAVISAVENSATVTVGLAKLRSGPKFLHQHLFLKHWDVSNPSLFPATDFQGLQVLFNGRAVPLYAITPSANQINVVVPSELPSSGTATINVQNSSGVSQDITLTLAQDSVGVFRIPDSSHPNNGAVVLNGTTWLVMPASTAAFYNFQPCTGMPVTATHFVYALELEPEFAGRFCAFAEYGWGVSSTVGSTGYGFWNRQVLQWNQENQRRVAAGLILVGAAENFHLHPTVPNCTFTTSSNPSTGISTPYTNTANTYWYGDAVRIDEQCRHEGRMSVHRTTFRTSR